MTIDLKRLAATAAVMLAAVPHALVACASPTPAPDPRVWAAVKCVSCDRAGVVVETRRSVDANGRAGRYLVARVTNLNEFAVTFVLDLHHDGPPSGDPDSQRRQLRLTVPAGGDSMLTMEHAHVAAASVSALERL